MRRDRAAGVFAVILALAACDRAGDTAAASSANAAATPAPAVPEAVAATPTNAPLAPDNYPSDGWDLPVAANGLAPADIAAIMTAGHYKRSGDKWLGCGGQSEATIVDGGAVDHAVADLNADGHPDVLITEEDISGGLCFNQYGQGFQIIAATPHGWRSLYSGTGMPEFRSGRGVDGWPDLIEGGPGMDCYPTNRWTGKTYQISPDNRC